MTAITKEIAEERGWSVLVTGEQGMALHGDGRSLRVQSETPLEATLANIATDHETDLEPPEGWEGHAGAAEEPATHEEEPRA